MRRLFLQIYLGFVAIALVLLILGGAAQWLEWRRRPPPAVLTGVVEMIGTELSEGGDGGGPRGAALQRKLADLARRLRVDATVWSPTGEKLAAVGRTIGPPALDGDPEQWLHRRRHSPGIAVRLRDGRWLGLALSRSRHEGTHWPFGLLAIAGVIALGAYPVARRITRRLERLRAGVEELGSGDLTARVPIEGRDEVADLARSFNRAAERIESLVGTQRRLLASASHELRTPLARLRVAVEILGAQPGARPELVREAAADIAELDELIEDLLLAARLEGAPEHHAHEPVELLALLAEEGALRRDRHGRARDDLRRSALAATPRAEPPGERAPPWRRHAHRSVRAPDRRGSGSARGVRPRPGDSAERARARVRGVLPARGPLGGTRRRRRSRPRTRARDRSPARRRSARARP
ncbi:MAG: HAMP domain-containing protein [Deltaproteobacteria bacterium]|nr:HAMP domain-containing protein [Deltaproteobacteria bacterium]